MHRFWSNCDAVLDLPMRLTVAVIIGGVALAAILGFILNPCLFPGKMIVSVDPIVGTLPAAGPGDVSFDVIVTDSSGRPVTGALVIIKGLGGISNGNTGVDGKISLTIAGIDLESGVYEGYLDVDVKAPCFESFSQPDMIKIIRS